MRARVGNWLVVEGTRVDDGRREGQIIELRHSDGSPPYVVRWLDNGHVSLVFPGPDARVVEGPPHAVSHADRAG
ncbi:DUF1918 domain-containing protein [Streptoalloteichus hindustanus]|uniref:DUF1918 domain-containing protein n=1 Tax=Streptoalloteichus hindustanus TaxID=2017 RepID=A0A1M5DU24_STRHI|nr:DUF1918 domain-containing protein [Streptoalloteichus hindustanus]SHF70440.1 protein of unknown function [Streptoalloteichus hindustanus]